MKGFDLNKLLEFARQQGASFTISYWQSGDELEIEIHSSAESEKFYQKRVISIDHFIEIWKEHFNLSNAK